MDNNFVSMGQKSAAILVFGRQTLISERKSKRILFSHQLLGYFAPKESCAIAHYNYNLQDFNYG